MFFIRELVGDLENCESRNVYGFHHFFRSLTIGGTTVNIEHDHAVRAENNEDLIERLHI